MFARGLDDRTWQNTFLDNRWLGWFPHNDATPIADTPSAGSMNPGHLHLFVTDPTKAAIQEMVDRVTPLVARPGKKAEAWTETHAKA